MFYALTASSVLLMIFLPFADRFGLFTMAGAHGLRMSGLALCAAGSAIRLAAVWSLGRQFTT